MGTGQKVRCQVNISVLTVSVMREKIGKLGKSMGQEIEGVAYRGDRAGLGMGRLLGNLGNAFVYFLELLNTV